MGLSHEHFSPMGASSAKMQSLLARSRPIDSDLEFRPPTLMQHASFANHKKRPFDSNLEFQLAKQRQHFSFGNNKRRPFASNLEYQPPKQRQRMGLSHFSPMGASSAKMQS